jgi:hypothetical protein
MTANDIMQIMNTSGMDWHFATNIRSWSGMTGCHIIADDKVYWICHDREWDAVEVETVHDSGGKWDSRLTSILRNGLQPTYSTNIEGLK